MAQNRPVHEESEVLICPQGQIDLLKNVLTNTFGFQRKELTIPLEERDGDMVFSQCKMYDFKNNNQELNDLAAAVCGIGRNTTAANVLHSDRLVNVSSVQCTKWEFDTSLYGTTIVTEVLYSTY